MTIDTWEKVRIWNHQGLLDKNDHNIKFYGIRFSSVLSAKDFLKNLKPGTYVPWIYKFHVGIRDPIDGSVYIDSMWFGSEDDARLYFSMPKGVVPS